MRLKPEHYYDWIPKDVISKRTRNALEMYWIQYLWQLLMISNTELFYVKWIWNKALLNIINLAN